MAQLSQTHYLFMNGFTSFSDDGRWDGLYRPRWRTVGRSFTVSVIKSRSSNPYRPTIRPSHRPTVQPSHRPTIWPSHCPSSQHLWKAR
jgi:hypothetical protein